MNALISYLLEQAPWFVAIAIAAYTAWKISKYHTRLENTQDKVKDLPCDKHQENIQKSNNLYQELQKTVTSTNDMVLEISKWIMKFDNDMINNLAKKASPLKMTSIGKIVFEQSGAKRTIDENKDFLFNEIDAIHPSIAAAVEEESFSVLMRNIGHTMFGEVKQYLYYSPETIQVKNPDTGEEEDVKLSMQSILSLMSIYLREEYLNKHPEIQ